jgi:hypothetical protein
VAEFETPALKPYPEIPPIEIGTMAHSKPYVAKEDLQQKIGFPGELVDNWEQVAIDKMGELVNGSRALRVFLDSCVK